MEAGRTSHLHHHLKIIHREASSQVPTINLQIKATRLLLVCIRMVLICVQLIIHHNLALLRGPLQKLQPLLGHRRRPFRMFLCHQATFHKQSQARNTHMHLRSCHRDLLHTYLHPLSLDPLVYLCKTCLILKLQRLPQRFQLQHKRWATWATQVWRLRLH